MVVIRRNRAYIYYLSLRERNTIGDNAKAKFSKKSSCNYSGEMIGIRFSSINVQSFSIYLLLKGLKEKKIRNGGLLMPKPS